MPAVLFVRRRRLPGLLLVPVAVLLLACQRARPLPDLAGALAVTGPPAAREAALVRVVREGESRERRRAALLAGLFACDAGRPVDALAAFDLAAPPGGRGTLAARRIGEALEAARADAALWQRAASAPWLARTDRDRLRVRGAAALAATGGVGAARALLGDPASFAGEERARALALLAGLGDAPARRALAVEFPHRFASLRAGESLAAASAQLSATERSRQAAAWLEAGQPGEALAAAGRAGDALIAARAANRLRRPTTALGWARRLGNASGPGWLEQAEAHRQLGWGGTGGVRAGHFRDMARAAERAAALLPAGGAEAGRAELFLAEALAESPRFTEAAPRLATPGARRQPRWDWVVRRHLYLAAQRGGATGALADALAFAPTRTRRIALFWQARRAARSGDRRGYESLASAGLPDLPALWSARELGVPVVVSLADDPSAAPPAPVWVDDLVAVGRVSDAVVAWRADLEALDAPGPAWLALVELAQLPPLDAIPLLVRGEPRLLSGPWRGLPRTLLERYLPLPWRAELERASARASVPPWVLAGLVRQESAWKETACSAVGAVGLAQVLPDTGAELVRAARLPRAWSERLTDPEVNLTLGALLLARWQRSVGGSLPVALACYNGGARRVVETWQEVGRRDGAEFVEALELPETWDYVHRVALLAEGYRVLYWPDGKAYPWT
jgi:soluble lytic murein transglycosylase-like protein